MFIVEIHTHKHTHTHTHAHTQKKVCACFLNQINFFLQIGKHNSNVSTMLSNNISSGNGGNTSYAGTGGTALTHLTGMELVSSPPNSHKMLQPHNKFKLVSYLSLFISYCEI